MSIQHSEFQFFCKSLQIEHIRKENWKVRAVKKNCLNDLHGEETKVGV